MKKNLVSSNRALSALSINFFKLPRHCLAMLILCGSYSQVVQSARLQLPVAVEQVPENTPKTVPKNNLPMDDIPVTDASLQNAVNDKPLADSIDNADEHSPTENVPLGAVSPVTVEKFVKLMDTVRREYAQPVSDEALFTQAMTGMLAGLDPYSEYLSNEAYENLRLFTEGDMGSIGVKVRFDENQHQWVFSEVLPQSPAAKAGIQPRDYLHQINDNKLQDDQTQQDVDQLISGIAGTQVKLIVSNQGRRKHAITLQRSLVEQQSIQVNVIDGIAVIQIPIFQNNTEQQLLSALASSQQPFGAILLDLRNNPGGVLTAASDVASLFMQDKTLVQVHDRNGIQEIITTHGKAPLPTIPLAVLQNRYSASASEVLAVSLQENNRAKILGETSYGKGSIQTVVPLSDKDAVKLTVAHYLSGKGKKIDGIGVIPDLPLAGGELTWENQGLAYLIMQPRSTRYALQNDKNVQEF